MGFTECIHISECSSSNTIRCRTCALNRKRNFVNDFYTKAADNPIPETCPPMSYSGPAEQTKGYKCPVCGNYTNPYQLVDGNCCSHCGYRFTTIK